MIKIRDKEVGNIFHGKQDITCGGTFASPAHRLSEKLGYQEVITITDAEIEKYWEDEEPISDTEYIENGYIAVSEASNCTAITYNSTFKGGMMTI